MHYNGLINQLINVIANNFTDKNVNTDMYICLNTYTHSEVFSYTCIPFNMNI